MFYHLFSLSKEKIDVIISTLNPSKLNEDLDVIKQKGVELNTKINDIKQQIIDLGDVEFDEDRHYLLTKNLSSETTNKAVNEAEVNRLKKVIDGLIAGGICQSCNRKLDNVDNTEHIKKHELQIKDLNEKITTINDNINKINVELISLNKIKLIIDSKNRLELDKDRLDVEVSALRAKFVAKKADLDKYNMNLASIEFNKEVDIKLSKVKTDLTVANHAKDDLQSKIQRVTSDKEQHESDVITKTKLIETIKKEEEVDKIYKIYIELVGKKGISKLVLRSVLPIINSEVQRLLEDVCDFEIEIFIDDKNDVQFLIVKDGVSKLLKSGSGFEKTASSLALRSILGKMSTLPMPNFITFDEVLGKVALENLDKLKPLFDKIKTMYDIVFLITHNDLIKDWADSLVTIVKETNLSRLSIK